MTRVNQGLFSTTMEAEKRDPGNEVGPVRLSFAALLNNLNLYIHTLPEEML